MQGFIHTLRTRTRVSLLDTCIKFIITITQTWRNNLQIIVEWNSKNVSKRTQEYKKRKEKNDMAKALYVTKYNFQV